MKTFRVIMGFVLILGALFAYLMGEISQDRRIAALQGQVDTLEHLTERIEMAGGI